MRGLFQFWRTKVSEEIQQEVDVSQQDLAMEAAFAEARGDEPPAEEPKAAGEPAPAESEQQPDAQVDEQQPAEEAQPPVLIAGLTEDQLKAALLKVGQVDELNGQLRKAFGRMGELQGHIQQLQKSGSGGVKLSADKLKRLSSEFPEMAQMIAEDLSEALGSGGGPAFDPSQVDQLVSERLTAAEEKIQKEMEKRWLTRQHKDWQQVVASDDFNLWVQNVLTEEEAEQFVNSWDAEYVSEKLSEFKRWNQQSIDAKRSKEEKQKRLESAVTPSGTRSEPNATMTEDEAMDAAYRASRRI